MSKKVENDEQRIELDKVGGQEKKTTKMKKKKKGKKTGETGQDLKKKRDSQLDGGRNASAWVCCLLDNVASKPRLYQPP